MKYIFEVKRNRASVTQGSATVYLNGEEMITFGDTIELVNGQWVSIKKDSDFIKGLFFHPFEDVYEISKEVKNYFEKSKKYEEVSSKKATTIITSREPLGKFWLNENDKFVAIDNSDGQAWTEDFDTLSECIDFLEDITI